MLTIALFEPVVAGENVTLIEQLAVAARLLPQVVFSPNSAAFTPERPIVIPVSEAFPVFVSVTDC